MTTATRLSCYMFEPWHYRFVGVEIATAIHEADAVPRAYPPADPRASSPSIAGRAATRASADME